MDIPTFALSVAASIVGGLIVWAIQTAIIRYKK